jgi:hypothetical protein
MVSIRTQNDLGCGIWSDAKEFRTKATVVEEVEPAAE